MSEEELEAGRRLPQQDPAGWHGGGEGSRFDSQGRPRSFEDSMQWPVGHKGRDSSRFSNSNPSFDVPSGKGGQHSELSQTDSASGSDEEFLETEDERWAFQTASGADSDSSDDDEVGVVLTRHGRPSKTASKKSGAFLLAVLLRKADAVTLVSTFVRCTGIASVDGLHVCAPP